MESSKRLSQFNPFHALKRSSTFAALSQFSSLPKSNGVGPLLGEFSITLPTHHVFSKIIGTYGVTNSKKDVAKIVLHLGMFVEEKFCLLPDLPEYNFKTYLDFQVHSKSMTVI